MQRDSTHSSNGSTISFIVNEDRGVRTFRRRILDISDPHFELRYGPAPLFAVSDAPHVSDRPLQSRKRGYAPVRVAVLFLFPPSFGRPPRANGDEDIALQRAEERWKS